MSKTRDELIAELAELDDLEESEDVPVDAAKPSTDSDAAPVLAEKKKIPRTQKQIDAFKATLELRKANIEKRKAEKEAAAEAERKILEEKLIKKAIALKKKQMKARAVIDNLPEDDEPVVKPKAVPAVPAAPAAPPKPVIHFF